MDERAEQPPVVVYVRTQGSMNAREHPMQRHRRVLNERHAVSVALRSVEKPSLPCVVVLSRRAPSSGLDDDNLVSCLKGCRDAVAAWLKIDDAERETVRYRYTQARSAGSWSVWITFEPPTAGQQLQIEVGR